jgi:hypothetical protein
MQQTLYLIELLRRDESPKPSARDRIETVSIKITAQSGAISHTAAACSLCKALVSNDKTLTSFYRTSCDFEARGASYSMYTRLQDDCFNDFWRGCKKQRPRNAAMIDDIPNV